MDILVLGRQEAEWRSPRITAAHIWISISEPGWAPPNLAPNTQRLATLDLWFHDITEPRVGYDLMSVEQARDITGFVTTWKDKVSLIVVNCEAGISRSAGVAAALDRWLNQQDRFSADPHYFPNAHVLRLLCREVVPPDWSPIDVPTRANIL